MSDQLQLFETPAPSLDAALKAAGVGNHIGRPPVKRPVEQVMVKVHDSGHVVAWVSRMDRTRVYMAIVGSGRGKRLLRRAQTMQRILLANGAHK